MKVIYTLIFSLIISISGIQAQNDPFEGLDLFQELFGSMMNEMGQAMEDSKLQMERLELEDLGNGKMNIDGDTVNISGMFRMLSDNMKRLPEPMRPNEDHLENLDETAKVLPDLLLKSAEMFKSGSFEDMFEQLFNDMGMEMPEYESKPRDPNLNKEVPSDEPRPTRPKGEKEEKPLKKMKHRKTIQI